MMYGIKFHKSSKPILWNGIKRKRNADLDEENKDSVVSMYLPESIKTVAWLSNTSRPLRPKSVCFSVRIIEMRCKIKQ